MQATPRDNEVWKLVGIICRWFVLSPRGNEVIIREPSHRWRPLCLSYFFPVTTELRNYWSTVRNGTRTRPFLVQRSNVVIPSILTHRVPYHGCASYHSNRRCDTLFRQTVPNSLLLCWYSAMAFFVEFASRLKPLRELFESWSIRCRAFSFALGNGTREFGSNKHSRHIGCQFMLLT